MRNCFILILTSVAILAACQPITPIFMKAPSFGKDIEINDPSPTPPASATSSKSDAHPVKYEPPETLSLDNIDLGNDQTKTDFADNATIFRNGYQTGATHLSPTITPKIIDLPETFDPKKMIGFASTSLIQNLGKANMIRQEGTVQVWQYQFSSCVVDFFFYPIDEKGSKLISKSWDMRSAIMGDHLNPDNCLKEMNLYHLKILSN